MPSSSVSVQHALTQQEALRRIRTLMTNVKAQYAGEISDLEEDWADGTFRFKAKGFRFKGKLNVTNSSAQVSLDLPFAALPWKGKIENSIRQEAEKALKTP